MDSDVESVKVLRGNRTSALMHAWFTRMVHRQGRMLRPAFNCNGWKSTSKPDDELISTVPWLLFFGK